MSYIIKNPPRWLLDGLLSEIDGSTKDMDLDDINLVYENGFVRFNETLNQVQFDPDQVHEERRKRCLCQFEAKHRDQITLLLGS